MLFLSLIYFIQLLKEKDQNIPFNCSHSAILLCRLIRKFEFYWQFSLWCCLLLLREEGVFVSFQPSLMASSSCTSTPQGKYDVFLSFRGEDTRDNFTSHLYAALCRKKVETFIDNELERGDGISPALLRAIEESKLSVIIFSKDYASSVWCLDELSKILECKKTMGRIIIPVFYHIDPSNVRKQSGSFADAFAKHEERFKEHMDKVQRWRAALREVANLSGWDSLVTRPESILIEKIVADIIYKLNHMSSSHVEGLVGMESHIKKIGELLCCGSADVRIVGIWGMGGIGKMTIAEAVYNLISSQFESCCFLANVREESENCGLLQLRDKFLSKILEEENLHVGTPSIGSAFLKDRLHRKRVLIVLDDVNNVKQLELLAGEHHWFGLGSKIVITTRDKHLLKGRVDAIYEVQGLAYRHALELFCHNAFKENHPIEDYIELSNRALKYAKGIPLALKVLGSFLRGRSKQEWRSGLNKLEKTQNSEIQNVLRISYCGLDDEEKNIFLDVAYFHKGRRRQCAITILDACGFSADIGISVLIDRALITISKGRLWMHDLIQEMGWDIVRQECLKEPGKRSRLSHPQEIYHVLTKNTGTEAVEGISLQMSKMRVMHLSPDVFASMQRLRFLEFFGPFYYGGFRLEELKFHELSCCYGGYKEHNSLHLSLGLNFLSDELRYLRWDGYPLQSLPSNFHPENLVELHMSGSDVVRLWDGVQDLVNLKVINLRHSKHLIEIPDLSRAINLVQIDLDGCTSLVKIPSSFRHLIRLERLELMGCKSLRSLPSNMHLNSLRIVYLSRCSNLKTFPEISWNIESLLLDDTAIEEVPSSIEYFSRLSLFSLGNCMRISSLPNSICKLVSLRNFNLNGTAIRELPSSIENLIFLGSLNLRDCKSLVSLPDSICNLKYLSSLVLIGCSKVDKLPENLGNLKNLWELRVDGTAIKQLPSSVVCLNKLAQLSCSECKGEGSMDFQLPPFSALSSLRILYLSDCNLWNLPGELTCLKSLENLQLGGNNFESIPASIKQLSELLWLDLSYCKRLRYLPELPPHLKFLDVRDCTSLENVSSSVTAPLQWLDSNSFQMFVFTNCFKLDRNSRCNIVGDAQQKIQLMAMAAPKLYWGFYPTPSAGICFPGNEIPEWFNYQGTGSFATIKLPPNWRSPKFLGFTLCTVVNFDNYSDESNFAVRCDCLDIRCYFSGWCGQKGESMFVRSEHTFLWYDYCLSLKALEGYNGDSSSSINCYNQVSFEFCPVDKDRNPLNCCKVTKCGVCLLYAQDEKSYSSMVIQAASADGDSGLSDQIPGDPGAADGTGTKSKRFHHRDQSVCGSGNSCGKDPERIKEL